MAIKTFFTDSADAQYTSEELAWLQQLFLGAGIFGDSAGSLGLAVSQRGAGANMSVDVAIGNALINFTKVGRTWKVILMNNAVVNVPIASNASGINRVDAIVCRIDVDVDANSLKNNIGTIERVAGSGASALSDGAITALLGSDGWIRLADVTVSNGAVSIVNANIADIRTAIKTNDAIILAPKNIKFTVQASDPSSLVEGQFWYNSTNHTLNYYNGTTTKVLGSSQGLFNPLIATAQASPNMTLAVTAGVVRFGGQPVKYAGGNSGSFTAPSNVNEKRIDLLCLNSAGSLVIVQGVATTGAPVAPNYPNGMFVISEVYLRNAGTVIKDTDDSTNGYVLRDARGFEVDPSSFMGTGEDGDLIIKSGATNIDLGGLAVVTKQYRKISITGTGQLTFSNPHANGTIIRLKSQGDVDLTSSTIPNIDASGMGGAGGAGSAQVTGASPNAGGNGNTGNGILDVLGNHGGQGVTAGTIVTANNLYSFSDVLMSRGLVTLICGSGGGGGSGGSDGNGGAVNGGDGGRGGGALQINCGGYLNFTSALGVSVAGKNGANGTAKSSTNGAGGTGGGGGGSGGTCFIFYNFLTSASGTINSAGGAGGTGGNATDTGGGGGGVQLIGGAGGGGAGSYAGAGGNGGAQVSNINQNGNVGSNAGGARAGGGGGSGAASMYNSTTAYTGATGGTAGASENALVLKNVFF